MNEFNSVTKLLMAAVHLYPDDFITVVQERVKHPYKSPSPEYGMNMAAVCQELEDEQRSRFRKSTFLLAAFIVIFLIFILNPEENWWVLLLGYTLGVAGEFFFFRSVMKKVRKILGGNIFKSHQEGSLEYFSSDQRNVIISGGYSPFIGAGLDLNSWSFTVDLREPSDKQKPVNPATSLQLHDVIKGQIAYARHSGDDD